jgi:hypothetical protein
MIAAYCMGSDGKAPAISAGGANCGADVATIATCGKL